MKITLRKAINFHGEEIKELKYDLDELTGNDLLEIEKQLQKTEQINVITDGNKIYLIAIAARALKMPVEVLKSMNARDFTIVTNDVLSFLLGLGSYAPSETEIPETLPEASSKE